MHLSLSPLHSAILSALLCVVPLTGHSQVRSVLHGDPNEEATQPLWVQFMRNCVWDDNFSRHFGGNGLPSEQQERVCACTEVAASETLSPDDYAEFLREGGMRSAYSNIGYLNERFSSARSIHCAGGGGDAFPRRLAEWQALSARFADAPDLRDPYGPATEPVIAARARAAGLVYRNRGFWGDDPFSRELRAVFEGDAPMLDPVTLARFVRGWSVGYARACPQADLVPAAWPDAAQLAQLPTMAAIWPGLSADVAVPAQLETAFAEAAGLGFIPEAAMTTALDLIARGRRAEIDVVVQLAGAELAAGAVARKAGCGTPTAQQFSGNLLALWFGAPTLHESGASLAGAEEDSDAFPG
jgi:hypothetical protein